MKMHVCVCVCVFSPHGCLFLSVCEFLARQPMSQAATKATAVLLASGCEFLNVVCHLVFLPWLTFCIQPRGLFAAIRVGSSATDVACSR
jgi:hypothetical protein